MKRISQRDIAKILGINVSTVSRALRGLDGVSPDGFSERQWALDNRQLYKID